MPVTRYYCGSITECIEGYEFSSTFVFKVEGDENLDEVTCGIERDFRPECDDIYQKDMVYYEIDEEEFEVMSKHISVLGI